MAQVIFDRVYKSFPRHQKQASTKQTEGVQTNASSEAKEISVLRNINLTVKDGEFMVLVGQSGCGKSTLLRLLAGLESLTGGNISIGDRSIANLPPKARDIAMVFQNYALYPHLSVYDNIAFGLRRARKSSATKQKQSTVDGVLTGITRSFPKQFRYLSSGEKAIAKRVISVARLLQIESLLDRLPKELSGGQKQRVALGRAIARNPQVFLMDEPLSNLDAKLRTETRGQIVELQQQLGITTIYVTHDQTEAMTMGDRIAVMDRGQIQQVAPPLEVYNNPANLFVAGFIGSPTMNFLSVEWVGKTTLRHPEFKITLPDSWQEILRNSNSRSLVLGIRPQHLEIASREESDFSVRVDSVEALGNETYIYACLKDDSCKLTISTNSDRIMTKDDILCLKLNLDKIHLFKADTGESLIVD